MYAWKYVWYGLGQLYELQIMGIELYKELKYTEISVKPKNVENSNRRDHFIYIPKDKQLYTKKKKGGGAYHYVWHQKFLYLKRYKEHQQPSWRIGQGQTFNTHKPWLKSPASKNENKRPNHYQL